MHSRPGHRREAGPGWPTRDQEPEPGQGTSPADAESPERANRGAAGPRRWWPVLTPVAALAIAVSLLSPAGRHQWALSLFRQPAHYTALFFDKPAALPTSTSITDAIPVSFTVANHEGRPVSYRYVLTSSSGGISQVVGRSQKVVPAGGAWTVWRVIRPGCVASPCRIAVSLPGHPERIDFLVTLGVDGGNSPALPSWAIGQFERYQGNPVLTPPVAPDASTAWEWPETFNPGVVVVKGVFHMLYRGATSGNYSSIGAATSTDGYHFTPVPHNPVISRALPSEAHGVENPRLYYRHGMYYAFFTGHNRTATDINEAVSKDAVSWKQLGPVLKNTNNAAVVADPTGAPVLINGHYLMYYGQSGGTYLAQSADLVHWTRAGAVNPGFPASYNPFDFCVAVTNYRTSARGPLNRNIDLFVAGTLMARGRWYYAISEINFARNNLRSVAAQLRAPVLYPQAPYEKYGATLNAVFMNSILFYKNKWWMYYGAADSVVALANAPLRR